jgi:hypothetical protein
MMSRLHLSAMELCGRCAWERVPTHYRRLCEQRHQRHGLEGETGEISALIPTARDYIIAGAPIGTGAMHVGQHPRRRLGRVLLWLTPRGCVDISKSS